MTLQHSSKGRVCTIRRTCPVSRPARRFNSLEFAAFASHMIQVMDGARRLFYRARIDSNSLEKTS
jgi:hypothetical protein